MGPVLDHGILAAEHIKLWPGMPPGFDGAAGEETQTPGDAVGNVSIPEIAVHHPAPGHSSGLGLLVCPGGSYTKVGTFSDGAGVVPKWVPAGATVVVLKYRTKPPSRHVEADALADARRALRLVRAHAAAWGVDSRRIGLIGFSAGSHLALNLTTHADEGDPNSSDPVERENCRPNFAVLLCPWPDGQTVAAFPLSHRTPPLFIASARDDRIAPHAFAESLAGAARAAGVPTVLWTVEQGGHTAFSPGRRGEGAAWSDQVAAWLDALRLLQPRSDF